MAILFAPWFLVLPLLTFACSEPSEDDTALEDDTGSPVDTQDDGCTDVEGATPFAFSPDAITGMDDLGSLGAALTIAVDSVGRAGLVLAFRFDLPFYSGGFTPGCDVEATAQDYAWGAIDPRLAQAASRWPWLAPAFTDTEGIRALESEMAGFLIVLGNHGDQQVFVAATGRLTLTRLDGKEAVVEGDLAFAEVTPAGSEAEEVPGGDRVRLDDLLLTYPYIP
ncbi:MAG: hypothetical protein JXB39_16165 [Deltaproteobacteria bacterium]|nr:hypothetical protein [Deltaproteobacteria bacterium]